MYYNTFRSTSKETMRRSNQLMNSTGSRSVNPRERLINMQKREKLKGLLITKFMKKYGIKNPEKILQDEISKFLEGENLTDADLKRLDEKLRSLLSEKEANETLRRNLTQGNDNSNSGVNNYNTHSGGDVVLPDLNKGETMSVHSKHSRMSGCSHLSKFNEKPGNIGSNAQNEVDFDCLSVSSNRKPIPRMDFSSEGDEWNAICLYNQKMFEEEKRLNKLKDMEVKRRTKEDLDNQIRHKLKRLNEEQVKNSEYDNILLNHMEYLNELEKEKELARKAKVLKEKENRDRQMKDEKVRKRIELNKEKKYEKELVKHLVEEMEKEKQTMIKKKIDEKEALQKTLKDNELNKIKQMEAMRKEREDDIKAMEEYAKILEKQENERKEYFNRIERNSNSFMSKMVETVLKDMDGKNKEEEEKMKKYMEEKERRDQEEEERRKIQNWENKKMMKNYLDMQVEEKKKMMDFEKTLNAEQARIWKVDTQNFAEQEKDINSKVRFSNTLNAGYLKNQIDMKKAKNASKMTDLEYALNRKTLESIKNNA